MGRKRDVEKQSIKRKPASRLTKRQQDPGNFNIKVKRINKNLKNQSIYFFFIFLIINYLNIKYFFISFLRKWQPR